MICPLLDESDASAQAPQKASEGFSKRVNVLSGTPSLCIEYIGYSIPIGICAVAKGWGTPQQTLAPGGQLRQA